MIKMLVCDFDGTISGGASAGIDKLTSYVSQSPELQFVIATGRTLPSIKQGLGSDNFPTPQTIISDVGTRIHHVAKQQCNTRWSELIESSWDREKIIGNIAPLTFLGKQNPEHQADYKITIEGSLSDQDLTELTRVMDEACIEADITYSHNWFLDITPKGVNKASAIHFLMEKHRIHPGEVCVAGDSANDTAMLTMDGIRAILVGNHYPEVAHLSESESVYTTNATHAEGVLEGLKYWQARSA